MLLSLGSQFTVNSVWPLSLNVFVSPTILESMVDPYAVEKSKILFELELTVS